MSKIESRYAHMDETFNIKSFNLKTYIINSQKTSLTQLRLGVSDTIVRVSSTDFSQPKISLPQKQKKNNPKDETYYVSSPFVAIFEKMKI